MTYRTRYTATFYYPGVFMPEQTTVDLPEPTYEAAVANAPDEPGNYFTKDGWYAVDIKTQVEKRYTSEYDDDVRWLPAHEAAVEKIIVGREFHIGHPELQGDKFRVLRSNIEYNSKAPYENLAVLTRSGNWQIRSDWDRVVAP